MFDFLRNLTKSEEEKRQETLSAYLDNALAPQERQAFEEELRVDIALRANLEQQQAVKQNLGSLPQMRAPRNFTLDPAAYGRPAPQPAFKLYPIMRTATALTAVLLIVLFSLDLFSLSTGNQSSITGETTAQLPAEAPLAANDASSERETADTAASDADGAAEPEPALANGFEAPSEGAGEAAPAMDEEAVVEEAMEEEAMEEEAAAEEAVEEQETAEEETAGEETLGQIPPAVTESEESAGGYPSAQPTVETAVTAEEGELEIVGGDGYALTLSPTITPTQDLRATQTLPRDVITQSYFYSLETPPSTTVSSIPTAPPGVNDLNDTTPPLSPTQLLQIGLGVLFLVLLATTLLLRRQL